MILVRNESIELYLPLIAEAGVLSLDFLSVTLFLIPVCCLEVADTAKGVYLF